MSLRARLQRRPWRQQARASRRTKRLHNQPHTEVELIPGVREQGQGLKCYVESDYAPLKACIVGNPSAIYLPNPDTWEYANILAKVDDETKDYMRKHAGRDLKESE